MGIVTISQRGVARIRGGHPWVFQSDVIAVEGVTHGDCVQVRSPRGSEIGTAFYSATSQITLRWLGSNIGSVQGPLFKDRIAAAAAKRATLLPGRQAYRMVYGESDRLPSIIIDRYGDHFVFQTLSAGAERWKGIVADALEELFGAKSITERNDSLSRRHEELPLVSQIYRGSPEFPIIVQEGEMAFQVDPLKGQKTGLYLDQAVNRISLKRFLKGKVLDAFCYQGGFACHAAPLVDEVVAVDISAAALSSAQHNLELNSLGNVRCVEANIFDLLRQLYDRGEYFDGMILDPPSFIRNRATLEAGIRGYKEIHLRAVRLLKPGGILITSSCSQHLGEKMLVQLLMEVAHDTRRDLLILEKRGQPPDHPVLLTFPESDYLKTLVLQVF